MKLSDKPEVRTAASAARVFAEYIGESDREVFVVALLTIRHRIIGLHTVSVGCLSQSLVHPRSCFAEHNRGYVAAVAMLRGRFKALAC